MTQTFRHIPGQRADVRRPGIVYGVNILDPATGQVHVDYVGQTRQQLLSRERQHRDERPFSDLIVGDAFVIEQGMWTDAELDERELFHIQRIGPRMNHDGNLDNPARIPIWRQRQDRDARDRAKGLPVRRWPAPRPGSAPASTVRRPKLSLRWRRRRNWAAGLTAGWLAATVLLWWADASIAAVDAAGRTYPIVAAALTALVPALRLRRRRDRRLAVLLVTVACGALLLVTD
ncbi:hypothetical protein GCM10010399_82700 [Dactylosporangium fulvum]|uniref:GIY-YIG domain-containing protein n=1 Tax=Dactylosporangium fulvum TaxID=53359 RepID=A0ABY5WA08_9ACTN|nr:hypothetical protein [Dactylosporangium fulvum]UWP85859.1 hypothetical protein Dfulv_17070 [Dactylosporangium fulvum]